MKISMKDIGARIKEVRSQKGLTQESLGNLIGVQGAAVSKYEKGDADPGTTALAKIAEIGSISLDWLITGKERDEVSIPMGGGKTNVVAGIMHEMLSKREELLVQDARNNFELLNGIIDTVEEHLQNNKLHLDRSKKAELITTLYEMFTEDGVKQVNKKTVGKLIKLAM